MVLTPMTMIPKYGQRNIYVGTFVLFLGFLCGSAGVGNLPGFLVFRLLSGLAGSPAISVRLLPCSAHTLTRPSDRRRLARRHVGSPDHAEGHRHLGLECLAWSDPCVQPRLGSGV